MAEEFDRDKCAAAAVGFLSRMRNEWIIKNPNNAESCPVPLWPLVSKADQAILIRAMHTAFVSASPSNQQQLKIKGII